MKRVVAIAVLFFSYSSYSQIKLVEKVSAEKPEVFFNCSVAVSIKEKTLVTDEDSCFVNSYKGKAIHVTENPLHSVKLVLPTKFNWLYYSVV